MNRRGFLLGMGALLAAPSIVRAGSLMPVKAPPLTQWRTLLASTNPMAVIEYFDGADLVWRVDERVPMKDHGDGSYSIETTADRAGMMRVAVTCPEFVTHTTEHFVVAGDTFRLEPMKIALIEP
jgi:hypothetical protein